RQLAIQVDHGVEHTGGVARTAGAERADGRGTGAVIPGQRTGAQVGPACGFVLAFRRAAQVADGAQSKTGQPGRVLVGEVAQHAGAVHAAPAHAGAVIGLVTADV